jgi:predicted helicase
VQVLRDSGIVNDPNDWAAEHEEPPYIVDLLERIVSVSMATNEIVERLPDLELLVEDPSIRLSGTPQT